MYHQIAFLQFLPFTTQFNCTRKERAKVNVKVKVKLPLCLTTYHVMKTYGRMEVQFHAFLTSVLDGGEWSISRPDLSPRSPGKRRQYSLERRLGGP